MASLQSLRTHFCLNLSVDQLTQSDCDEMLKSKMLNQVTVLSLLDAQDNNLNPVTSKNFKRIDDFFGQWEVDVRGFNSFFLKKAF